MATTEKPTALRTNLQQAEQAFTNLLTPEEEAPVEENVEAVEESVEEIEEVTEEPEMEAEAAEEVEEGRLNVFLSLPSGVFQHHLSLLLSLLHV